MPHIQIIERQPGAWALLINGHRCLFTAKPLALYYNSLKPLTPDAQLRWRVAGVKVSYRQIKQSLHNNPRPAIVRRGFDII